MSSYVPPKKNAGYILFIGLPSRANPQTLQVNPTIAAGDFKVSTDGGTIGNLNTLPTVTPAGGKMVKLTFSADEMNGDNVTLVCSDAAGAEWCDVVLDIQTSTRQVDDLATPTNITAGTIATVSGNVNGNVGGNVAGSVGSVTGLTASDVGAIKLKTDNLPSDPADASDVAAAVSASTSTIAAAIAALNNLSIANVRTAVGLASANLDTQLDALPTNAEVTTALAAADDAVLAAIALLNNLAPGAAMTLTTEGRDAVADALIARNIEGGSSTGRTVKEVFAATRNKVTVSGGTLTVYAADDTTVLYTATVTTTAGDPISGIDPA